ncbi:endonuclease reverse [Colletotrichum tofieldiae]|nr:endonuclease reverse [Colletotrichum tofieldiae]GKT68800.1 endonuclease reverse [Colletotrichum tofieldiae]
MVGYEPRKTKEELAITFTDRLGTFSKRDIVVYTDGSQMLVGSRTAAGAGWVGSSEDQSRSATRRRSLMQKRKPLFEDYWKP